MEQGAKSLRRWLILSTAAWLLCLALLPNDLPQDAVPHDGVASGELETADQAAHSFFYVGDGAAGEVIAATHGFEELERDAFEFFGGGLGGSFLSLCRFGVTD